MRAGGALLVTRSMKRCAAAAIMVMGLSANSAPASANEAHRRPEFITHPKAAGLEWYSYMSADSNEMLSVSCLYSYRFCLAGDNAGDVVEFNGLSWQASAAALSSGEVNSVSCSPEYFCAAVDNQGDAYTTAGVPTGEGWSSTEIHDAIPLTSSAWSATKLGYGASLSSVSCAGLDGGSGADIPQFCVAVDSAGRAFVYRGTWSQPQDIDGAEDLVAVSCPSYLFCMAIDQRGYEVTYQGTTVPAGPAQDGAAPLGTWSSPVEFSTSGQPTSLSCQTGLKANFQDFYYCFVGFSGGRVIAFSNGKWGAKGVADVAPITAFSCTDGNRCYASNQAGKVEVWVGAQHKWEDLGAIGTEGVAVVALSCPEEDFCVAVDANGDAFEGR